MPAEAVTEGTLFLFIHLPFFVVCLKACFSHTPRDSSVVSLTSMNHDPLESPRKRCSVFCNLQLQEDVHLKNSVHWFCVTLQD